MVADWKATFKSLGIAISLAFCGITIIFEKSSLAQITPDTTLGNETSIVTPTSSTSERIDGGAIRGSSLFHSFQEFNIDQGRRVDFANPVQIENIFSRVTGNNSSRLFGTLGVLGNANLFFINPNGIIFGADAKLDIKGSFVGSTANSLIFTNGQLFSATNPQAPPLLEIDVKAPIGVIFEGKEPGAINNQINLPGAKQNINLIGNNLEIINNASSNESSSADIQILATQNSSSEQNLLRFTRGNILLEATDNITIASGFTLNLISPDSITFLADADKNGRGSFRMDTNQTISSAGADVTISGANLNLGNISTLTPVRNGGNINLIATNGDISIGNPAFASSDNLTTSGIISGDINVKSSGNFIAYGAIRTDSFIQGTPGSIYINSGRNITINNGIRADSLVAGDNLSPINSGDIILKAGGNITTSGVVSSLSQVRGNSDSGNAGSITFITTGGNITTKGTLAAFSRVGRLRDGTAGNGTAGNGGAIKLESTTGSIRSEGLILTFSEVQNNGISGNGGNISITANDGITTNNFLNANSQVLRNGTTGNAGTITLKSTQGNIITDRITSVSEVIGNGNTGKGGNFIIESGGDFKSVFLRSYSQVRGNCTTVRCSTGNAGNITINSGGDVELRTNNSAGAIVAWSQIGGNGNAGNGGIVDIISNGNVSITNSNGQLTFQGSIGTNSQVFGNGSAGNGGNIRVISKTGDIFVNQVGNFSRVFGSCQGSCQAAGNGADITLQALQGSIDTFSVNTFSDSRGRGRAGNGGIIKLTAKNDITTNFLTSSSLTGRDTPGSSGSITVESTDGSIIAGNIIASSNTKRGNINLTAEKNITIGVGANSPVVDVSGSGDGGQILFNVQSGRFAINNALINSNVFGDGQGGDIKINADSVFLNNTDITTTLSSGTGQGGNIIINTPGEVVLDRSRLFTSLEPGGIGSGGNIEIQADSVSLDNFSFIDSATFWDGNAGNVSLNTNNSISLKNNSSIFSITAGNGNGGQVAVTAQGNLSLLDGSNISTFVNQQAGGNAGNVIIQANKLELSNGGQILTNTFGIGNAGDITVNAKEGVIISGVNNNSASAAQPINNVQRRIFRPVAEVEANNSFSQAQRLSNEDFSIDPINNVNPDVEFSTRIPYVSISGQGSNPTSVDIYSFEVTPGTRGIFDIDNGFKSGNTTGSIDTRISLYNNAGVRLASNNDAPVIFGAAGSQLAPGDINNPGAGSNTIFSPDSYLRYVFTQPGTYFLEVSTTARPQSYQLQISLDTPNIQSNSVNGRFASGIFAQTESKTGAAGNITINSPQLEINSGGQLRTTTFQAQKAGNITLQIPNQLILSGRDSGLFANTENGSTGNGGGIDIDPQRLIIRDGATIAVNSQGEGIGGDINLQAGYLFLDNGSISAQTRSNTGGNINLSIDDLLLLRHGSQISTTAGNQQFGGNGGNIFINARNGFIVAVPSENSDITANAFTGNGGRVDITTQRIFGIQEPSFPTLFSDITASSEFGINGEVAINFTINADPTNGLTELPDARPNPTISEGCQIVENKEAVQFYTIGKGGLPPRPDEALSVDLFNLIDWSKVTFHFDDKKTVTNTRSFSSLVKFAPPCQ
ncbi:filamentous hemagglutinin N-terminal domain-containing protein [Aulosira sp. FACHB-615]|uniref:two-partner secretion domain-containing protein n=1 Tax=Aulosira sp. FACHB-615 TaxID=2692777 RepID=UPI001685B834|nr:filamentous hemagglutinin N-terminal domain-containing protein [Aulosira sp. FACHB-615]MBD2492319.1 filamentous hemagglutinin N-terminal domain-containing protein [Aulosira sp. FACHB-615]